MRVEELTWNHPGTTTLAPHLMRVCEQGTARFKLLLLIEKDDPQPLELDIEGEGADKFLVGWHSQKDCWLEEDRWKEGEQFFVIRYVKLHDGAYIVWRCDHRKGRSFDLLRLFRGTFADMKRFYARKA